MKVIWLVFASLLQFDKNIIISQCASFAAPRQLDVNDFSRLQEYLQAYESHMHSNHDQQHLQQQAQPPQQPQRQPPPQPQPQQQQFQEPQSPHAAYTSGMFYEHAQASTNPLTHVVESHVSRENADIFFKINAQQTKFNMLTILATHLGIDISLQCSQQILENTNMLLLELFRVIVDRKSQFFQNVHQRYWNLEDVWKIIAMTPSNAEIYSINARYFRFLDQIFTINNNGTELSKWSNDDILVLNAKRKLIMSYAMNFLDNDRVNTHETDMAQKQLKQFCQSGMINNKFNKPLKMNFHMMQHEFYAPLFWEIAKLIDDQLLMLKI